MSIRFQSSVIFVEDIEASRRFYEDLLEQELEFDFGPNVSYVGGLAIWQVDHAHEIVFGKSSAEVGQGELELYFETDDVDAMVKRFADADVEFVHPLREQPWGQCVVRVYDPDGHIVELGEPMSIVIRRSLGQGITAETVAQRTSMPLGIVQQVAGSINN